MPCRVCRDGSTERKLTQQATIGSEQENAHLEPIAIAHKLEGVLVKVMVHI